jgi:hypothetical protein
MESLHIDGPNNVSAELRELEEHEENKDKSQTADPTLFVSFDKIDFNKLATIDAQMRVESKQLSIIS